MRQIIIAGILFALAYFGPLVLERFMTSWPEWAWRLTSVLCIIGGIVTILLLDPIYLKLKKPQDHPIFSTFIVAFSIAIIAGTIWWSFVVRTSEKNPPQTSAKQASVETELILYTAELSQPIREMWFKITLNKEVEYSPLLPLHFAFEISFDRDNSKTERYFVTDGGFKRHKKGKEINLSSFRITSGSMRKEGDQVHSQMFATGQQTLKNIVVPVSLSNSDQMTIKNFQGMAVIVFLPDKIIDIADRVEFIVNSRAILDQTIKSAVWVPQKINWVGVGEIVDLKRSATNDPKDAPAYSLWLIELFDKIPRKYSGIPGGYKPQFRSGN